MDDWECKTVHPIECHTRNHPTPTCDGSTESLLSARASLMTKDTSFSPSSACWWLISSDPETIDIGLLDESISRLGICLTGMMDVCPYLSCRISRTSHPSRLIDFSMWIVLGAVMKAELIPLAGGIVACSESWRRMNFKYMYACMYIRVHIQVRT